MSQHDMPGVTLAVERSMRRLASRQFHAMRAHRKWTPPSGWSLQQDKGMCPECNHIFVDGSWLRAPSPFNPDGELIGCPRCLEAVLPMKVCDEPGCVGLASCGFPSETHRVYRSTCNAHSEEMFSNWRRP